MNKRASLTTKAVPLGNYPDILGAISGGKHLNIDVLQIAVATRPYVVSPGVPFDALIFLQNTANVDVDAIIRLTVPETDAGGLKGRFSTNLTKPIRIGLRPAEVGVANLPLLCTAQTVPGKNYRLELEIQVEQKQRGALRIRDLNGGVPFDVADLPEERQHTITDMQKLTFSVNTMGRPAGAKATLTAPFEVQPAALAGLPPELKPGYVTLWTLADFPDEAMIVDKVKDLTAVILPQLNRTNVFFALLKTTQTHFEAAHFRLWVGEALAIAKLLTLVLETGVPHPEKGQTQLTYPHWYIRLCRLLMQNPRAAASIDMLVADSLYSDIVLDATALGFSMLTTVTRQTFGSAEETADHGKHLLASLQGNGAPLDFAHVYLPLVLAGIIANSRVSMPQEKVRDSASLMATARENRENLKNNDNKFLFDMADDLVTRALEHF